MDFNAGQDGIVDLGGGIFVDGSSLIGPPARRVRIEATCQWTGCEWGWFISRKLPSCFDDKKVQEPTLAGCCRRTRPREGDERRWLDLWSRPPRGHVPAFGVQYYTTKTITGEYIKWPAITLVQSTSVRYEVERTLIETIAFEVTADTQEILTDAADEETITIALQSEDVDQPIDPGGLSPIRDVRRRSFFPTDRGLKSISYLVARPVPSSCRAPGRSKSRSKPPSIMVWPVLPEECVDCQSPTPGGAASARWRLRAVHLAIPVSPAPASSWAAPSARAAVFTPHGRPGSGRGLRGTGLSEDRRRRDRLCHQ